MELDGYLGALGQLPSYDQLRSNALAIRGEQQRQLLEGQEGARRQTQFDTEQAQQQRFLADIGALGDNPDPQSFWRLAVRYPTLKGVTEAAQNLSENQRRQTVGSALQIHNALKSGRADLAKAIVQRSIDADKNAGGQPDPDDLALLSMIESGDPAQIKAAMGSTYAIAAAANPDTAAKNIVDSEEGERDFTLSAGGRRYSADGKLIAAAPFAPQYRSVGEGETLVEVGGGTEGGGPASGGGGGGNAPASGRTQYGWTPRARNGGDNNDAAVDSKNVGMSRALGVGIDDPFPAGMSNMQIARALALSEGGAGSIADRNNNPGNLRDPKTGAYRKFPTKEAGLQAAAAQVARNRARGQSSIRTMVEGLPVGGGQGVAASSMGGARVVAQGAPKEGYRMLTPQETQANGLDPNVRYQQAPNGQITALGGQSKAQLKPWPAGALDVRTTNNAALKNITAAITLLDPKNKSREAVTARGAIGPGTGMLGDTFTQWNSPEGTDARARIGQIGGLIIKDTSGAAVSLSEDQRLAKWVPLITDRPAVALAKLSNLRRELAQRNQSQDETYSENQGYRPFSSGSVVPVRSIQQANALPAGTLYRAPDGKVRRR